MRAKTAEENENEDSSSSTSRWHKRWCHTVTRLSAGLAVVLMTSMNLAKSLKMSYQDVSALLSMQELMNSPPVADQPRQLQRQLHKPLNVVVLYPDDWSGRDVGSLDPDGVLQTPTIDRLAREGVHFVKNAVTTSICWISRATLFSGRYVSGHRSQYLFRPLFASDDGQWRNSWPYLLQKAGYYVGHIGKWQYHDLGYLKKAFNYSFFAEGWIKRGTDTYIIHNLRDKFVHFVRSRPKDKPFAATVAFYPPKGIASTNFTHPKFAALYSNVTHRERYDRIQAYTRLPPFLQNNKTEARGRYLYRYETGGDYQEATTAQYATLSHLDSVMGEIVEELKRQGLYNNTLIIVTADNGEFRGAHALADKWYPYEESINVPLIVRDPRLPPEQRGQKRDKFTLNVDLAATILGAANVDVPDVMDGRDVADLYLEDRSAEIERRPWREEFYYEFPDINGRIPASYALVRHDYKYINWWKNKHEELFDLRKDPMEMTNLANRPELEELKGEMKRHLEVLRHDTFHPAVPSTRCDTILPRGHKPEQYPDCSPTLPDRCCGNVSLSSM